MLTPTIKNIKLIVAGFICCGLFFTSSLAFGKEELPSAEAFFKRSTIESVEISPDGDYAAMLTQLEGDRARLTVINLSDKSLTTIKGYNNVDISDIHWVNNNRIVFSIHNVVDPTASFPGLYAINRDGSGPTTLVNTIPHAYGQFEWSQKSTEFYQRTRSVQQDAVYVIRPIYSGAYEVLGNYLVKMNTKSGESETVKRPEDSDDWRIDFEGAPRATVSYSSGQARVYYRDSVEDKWRKIAEFPYIGTEGFYPFAFGPKGELYVTAYNGKNFRGLYRYDAKKNALDPDPIVSVDGYDFTGSFIMDYEHRKVLGVNYQTDAWSTLWFDEGMKKIQADINEKLPGSINQLSVSDNGPRNYVLVNSYSDVHPAAYYVYETQTGKLFALGDHSSQLDPKKAAQQDMVHYKARDGMDIPAYLTLPRVPIKKDLPMVVLVHGGPYVRGVSWGWDPEVQFLASRGYAVLQPEFRGSKGFGFKFFQAGWKQWGLAMQDDIADGTRWAIAQGIADPKRICIAGASYGGYATLMGLAKDKDLYRCGIDWVGVTDIDELYESSWDNDFSVEGQKYGLPILVGNRFWDSKKLKETSPVYVADQIKQPLLLAYGKLDHRVPLSHGQDFYDKIRKTNDKVEWIVYDDEGHGWNRLKNAADFWTRVEKFLDTNIGNP